MTTKLPPVLAAEDEESDALLLQLAAEKAGLAHPLVIVGDGQEVVEYLAGQPPYDDRSLHPLPALLLLDLKMPRMSGFDVLEWLAARAAFRDLPAVVFSSSSYESDVLKAKQLGALDYFVKPHSRADYVKILQHLNSRWLQT